MRTSLTAVLGACLITATAIAGHHSVAEGKDKSVLLLRDGRRLVGVVDHEPGAYVVQRGAEKTRVAEQEVLRWIPPEQLLAQLQRLREQPGAKGAFQTAQRAIFCFENGLDDKGWAEYGRLLQGRRDVASIGQLRGLAARTLLDKHGEWPLESQGRKLLLRCLDPKGDWLRAAHNDAAAEALRHLLIREREQARDGDEQDARRAKGKKKKLPELEALLRKYAEESVGSSRREVARRALLGDDESSRQFVYRLAARVPNGPTRNAIVAELEERKLRDDAAVYLGRYLNSPEGSVRLRAVEVLATLRSTAALPALRSARKLAIASLNKVRAGGSGGKVAPRGYIAVTTQQNYIADFDVEVASNATIAKPVVRTIQSGVVLDATVVGVEIITYYTTLVRKIDTAIRAIDKG